MSEAETKEQNSEVLVLKNSRVEVEIDPRGAFVNRLVIDGQDVLYPRTLDNPKRGGIPVLGPTPGPVEGTGWGNLYSPQRMPSHGTDRLVDWTVSKQSADSITLSRFIGPSEFDFAGVKEYEIKLLGSGLQIVATITNHTDSPKEIGHALHPYLDAREGFSVETQELQPHFPLTPKKSVKLDGQGLSSVDFTIGANKYSMETDPGPVKWILWSDKPEDYVCIEPWYAGLGSGVLVSGESSSDFSVVIQKHPASSSQVS